MEQFGKSKMQDELRIDSTIHLPSKSENYPPPRFAAGYLCTLCPPLFSRRGLDVLRGGRGAHFRPPFLIAQPTRPQLQTDGRPSANADGARLHALFTCSLRRAENTANEQKRVFSCGLLVCCLILLSGLMLCRHCPCLLSCLSPAPAGLIAGVYRPGALCRASCCPSLLCLRCPLPHSCGGWPVLRGRGVNALYMRAPCG